MKRTYSLKKSYDIEKVLKAKKSVGNKYYAIYYIPNKLNKPQMAISVSKKIGNAVERNYQKRVVRSIIREYFDLISNISFLVVIKKPTSQLTYLEKKSQLSYLLKRIVKQEKGVQNENK